MKLSKYYRKEHVGEDCYVLYNTLHMKPIIAKQDEVSKVENMGIHDPAVVEELLHSGIYVLDDSIDSNALIELQSNVESRFGEIKIVYIILTDVCNLRCSYCAVKNIADKNHVIDTYSLSKEKYTKFVKEYVSYAISHNISDPEFIFYGGEPLLNWSALIEIVELINTTANSTITPKYTVVTNGTLLTEDKIIFCKEHKINIGLSVDGPRSITDMTRKAENGMGAYPMIIHAMELLKKHDYIPSLSVTISEDVLRNQATVIDWLQEMHLSFGIKDISYNLLRFQDEGFDKKKYSIAASSFIIASYKQLGDIINDSRINRKILSLTRSTFFYGDCAAITGNQIVLKANGDIGLCQVFCQSDETTVGKTGFLNCYNLRENMNKFFNHLGDFVCLWFNLYYIRYRKTIDLVFQHFQKLISFFEYVYNTDASFFLETSRFSGVYFGEDRDNLLCAAFEEFIVNHFANNQVIIHTLNEEMLLAEIKDQ